MFAIAIGLSIAIASTAAAQIARCGFDGDSYVDAASDGLVIARYLFRLRDASLETNNSVSGMPTREGAALAAHIESVCPLTSPASLDAPPIAWIDTRRAKAARVGNGTPASHSVETLQTAVSTDGGMRLNFSIELVTVSVGSTINMPRNLNAAIDCGHRGALNVGGTKRILRRGQNNCLCMLLA